MPCQSLAVLHAAPGPFFGPVEEFECPEEEECEIDWDLMPSWEEEDGGEDKEATEEAINDSINDSSFGAQALQSLDKSRVKYEMNWQIEECQEDEDLCDDFCEVCAGGGKQACRFCRGTNMMAFANDIGFCLICTAGKEDCASCRGTGRIAPWAITMDEFLNNGPTTK
jgi:hypothetical protein